MAAADAKRRHGHIGLQALVPGLEIELAALVAEDAEALKLRAEPFKLILELSNSSLKMTSITPSHPSAGTSLPTVFVLVRLGCFKSLSQCDS